MAKKLSFLLVLYMLFGVSQLYAYIPIVSEAKDLFDKELKKSTQSMASGIREEVEIMMDTLFNSHLQPLIIDLDNRLKTRISDVDLRAEKRLDQVNLIINNTMRHLDNQFNNIDQLRQNIVSDVTRIQGEIIDNLHCTATGAIERSASKLDKLRDSFRIGFLDRWIFRRDYHSRLSTCRDRFNIQSDIEEWEYALTYDVNKCMKLLTLYEDSKVSVIMNAYIDLRAYSAAMRCVQYGAGDISNIKYAKEYFEMGQKYEIWRFANSL